MLGCSPCKCTHLHALLHLLHKSCVVMYVCFHIVLFDPLAILELMMAKIKLIVLSLKCEFNVCKCFSTLNTPST